MNKQIEEMQIEEMAHLVCEMALKPNSCRECNGRKGGCFTIPKMEILYNAGYRKQEWISVAERLPEEYGLYLIVQDGKVEVAYRQSFLFCEIWNNDMTGGFSIIPEQAVTHWMPLPEPPKMQRKEDEGK